MGIDPDVAKLWKEFREDPSEPVTFISFHQTNGGNSDDEFFALKVMHGVTDAPAVDIYANGELLVENLAYGDFQGYLQVPVGDYTLDITAHGDMNPKY